MRRPGLADDLQRILRVTIAGPSTLAALLNSLQMGFRTLALEKRSSEVWQVLGAVKTEFGKFGDVLAQTKLTLERAAKNIESAEVRSRQMARKLKAAERGGANDECAVDRPHSNSPHSGRPSRPDCRTHAAPDCNGCKRPALPDRRFAVFAGGGRAAQQMIGQQHPAIDDRRAQRTADRIQAQDRPPIE
jgi:hypothetical protein